MEPTPPPAIGGPALPSLSTTVLLAIAAIAGLVLASIFGYILFVAPGMRTDERLWWTGLASMIFALAFFLLYAATQDRKVARSLAAGFFVIAAGSFYGSVFLGATGLLQLVYVVVLSILVIAALGAIFVMARDAERDAIRKAQRRPMP